MQNVQGQIGLSERSFLGLKSKQLRLWVSLFWRKQQGLCATSCASYGIFHSWWNVSPIPSRAMFFFATMCDTNGNAARRVGSLSRRALIGGESNAQAENLRHTHQRR